LKELTMAQEILAPTQLTLLVVDDHELILGGTLDVLRQQYPEAKILTAQTAQDAIAQVANSQPDLIVIDLSIPEKSGVTAQVETGIKLLQQLMADRPTLNLMVQSSYVKALVRLKHDIDVHQGGFTVADKGLAKQEMLTRINWALQGITHTKDLKLSQNGWKCCG
jgi:DNA-binding NarL/FixJ family response regulator